AEAYLAGHRFGEAQRAATEALTWARSRLERGHEGWALHVQAEILSRHDAGARERVLPLLNSALDIAAKLGLRPLEARCHHTLGVWLAKEDPALAARHTDRAQALAGEIDMRLPAKPA